MLFSHLHLKYFDNKKREMKTYAFSRAYATGAW